jgi:hypothetical protein
VVKYSFLHRVRTHKKRLRKSAEPTAAFCFGLRARCAILQASSLRFCVEHFGETISVMRFLSLLFLLCVALESGCGSPAAQSVSSDDTRLRLLGRLYGQYMAENNGEPPADEKQLQDYLDKSAEFLKSQSVASPRDLLVSPRDGEPLIILYGKQIVPDENSGFPWIAYESRGADGKKYIIGSRGNVDEMTPEQIEAMAIH